MEYINYKNAFTSLCAEVECMIGWIEWYEILTNNYQNGEKKFYVLISCLVWKLKFYIRPLLQSVTICHMKQKFMLIK